MKNFNQRAVFEEKTGDYAYENMNGSFNPDYTKYLEKQVEDLPEALESLKYMICSLHRNIKRILKRNRRQEQIKCSL